MNSKNKKRIKTINPSTEQSGIITVNNIVASDRVPFGGVKKSGFEGSYHYMECWNSLISSQ